MLEARDAVASITRQPAVHLNGACSGGIISAGVLGHLAAEGRLGEVASLSLLVAALDNERAGTTAALADRELAAAAVAESARRGYLDGQALEGVFTWLRPNDLVWSYVVNNYLLGKEPPAFDVLFWNHDTVRLAAGLHRDFIQHRPRELARAPRRPRGARHPGRPRRRRPRQLHRRRPRPTTSSRGRTPTAALSCSAARRASCSPPAATSRRSSTRPGRRAARSYRVADLYPPLAPDAWAEQAATMPGSWWPDYDQWLAARSGELKPAPKRLGDARYKAQAKAPGTYVHAS